MVPYLLHEKNQPFVFPGAFFTSWIREGLRESLTCFWFMGVRFDTHNEYLFRTCYLKLPDL